MIAALALVLAVAAEPVTEDVAVDLAIRHGPALKALAAELDQARAAVDVDLKFENPKLRVSNLRSDRLLAPLLGEDNGTSPLQRAQVGLSWSPPNPWVRGALREKAMRRVEDAEAELEEARRSLVARVRTLHATIRGLDLQRELAASAVDRRRELQALTQSRMDRGAATVLDESLAALDALDALATLQEIESRRRQVLQDLLIQIGLAGSETPPVAGPAPSCPAPDAVAETLLAQARTASPKLRALRARVAALDSEASRLSLELMPWFDGVQVSYAFAGPTQTPFFGARFDLPIPLLDWNGPDQRVVAYRRAAVVEDQRAEDQAITARLQRALAERAGQAELVQRYLAAQPILDTSLDRLRRALDAAQADLVQIALVNTRVLSARRALLRATLECHLAQIEVDRIVGR